MERIEVNFVKHLEISNDGNRTEVAISAASNIDNATIRFGSSYCLNLSEADVDALRDALYDASRQLMFNRNRRNVAAY